MSIQASSDKLAEGIEPLNDSVYQLFVPPQGAPEVVVIFFHGLPQEDDYRKAYWKTWLDRDGTVIWPKEWLPERLPSAQILSISYDSCASQHNGAGDSYTIAERLIHDIILDARVGQECPVVLVGHSLGGIIIKEFLLGCLKRTGILSSTSRVEEDVPLIDKFVENCKGVFYYSTPHGGSRFIESMDEQCIPLNDQLMKLLKVLGKETARINGEFANLRQGKNILTMAMVENRETEYMGFKGQIVGESSARQDIDRFYVVQEANHFDVCRPKNKKSCSSFKYLLGFIESARKSTTTLRHRVYALLVPEDYVPKASTSQPARVEGHPEKKIKQRDPGSIDKLNDSVYELYTPPDGVPTRVVVVFFHGLPEEDDSSCESYTKTWLSRNDSRVVWPKEWLPEKLPGARILSVSYDCSVAKHDGQSDTYIIVENLIYDLMSVDVRVGQDCPVVLVGHCFGGIIIKALLLKCLEVRGQLRNNAGASSSKVEHIANFVQNCKGVFYYSTPHHGSKFIDNLFKVIHPDNLNPLMKFLKTLSTETERINNDFTTARESEMISTGAIGELLKTEYLGFEGTIVEDASARGDTPNSLSFYPVSANHFDVCRATNNGSCNIFTNLLEFIGSAMVDDKPFGGKLINKVLVVGQDSRKLHDFKKINHS